MSLLLLLLLTVQDNPYGDLIEQLASDSLVERSEAEDELVKVGDKAVPHLVKARKESEDDEVRARLLSALKRIGPATLDYIESHPKEAEDLTALRDEMYQEKFAPFIPTYMNKYVTVENGVAPKVDLDKIVIRFEEGTGFRKEVKSGTYYRIEPGKDGVVVDRARFQEEKLTVDRTVLPPGDGKLMLRMMLFASVLKVKKNSGGSWGSSSLVLLGARIEVEGKAIYNLRYWDRAGTNGQLLYLPMQTMQNILKDGLTKAKWEEQKLGETFRNDLQLRAAEYITPDEGEKLASGKTFHEYLKDALKED